jgi:DNA mismatch repair protein MutS
MRQYLAIKERHRDAILLYRMGDFYEMFYEDAREGAELLGITLTSRNNGRAGRVPLAGIPVRAVGEYLDRLIRAGRKVAICEQVEDPRLAKGLVRREVVEVITPGTVTSPGLLAVKENRFVAALLPEEKRWGIAFADMSTGEFRVTDLEPERVRDELARIDPAEIVLPEDAEQLEDMLPAGVPVSRFQGWAFGYDAAEERLRRHFDVVTLDGFGCGDRPEAVRAAGGLLAYIGELQPNGLRQIRALRTFDSSSYMVLDRRTIENLELLRPLRGVSARGTLLDAIDLTVTAMGGRRLRRWIGRPLMSVEAIRRRQDAVEDLHDNTPLRRDLRALLRKFHDLERVASRIASGRAGPRDLVSLNDTLKLVPPLLARLEGEPVERLLEVTGAPAPLDDLVARIDRAIVEDPPAGAGDGGVIRDGYHEGLDRLRGIARSGKEWIAGLQEEERRRTGIASLKVGFNRVFGYYIEVSRANLDRVPGEYVRKQTLTGAERFVTEALKEREAAILGAEERANALELEIFQEIRAAVAERVEAVQELADALAGLDVIAALAELAEERGYCRPKVDESGRIRIREGRHPVVERLVSAEQFVPNDTLLDTEGDQVIILTGPNMAGKSTYLRQVGLIVLMAQMGAFVPAAEAEIGVVDRIFTRVGAVDDLAGGQSTFLVEMTETANILNNATPRSLVLLDEIGRGTSTYDGVSIAWAVTEHLVTHRPVSARTIFATHYHELTELASRHPGVKNCNVLVKEWKEKVIFLRRIEEGCSDRSYGVEVARIAGLPPQVVARAREILASLERGRLRGAARGGIPVAPAVEECRQATLFEAADRRIVERLKELDLERMTPLDAMNALHELQEEADTID